MHKKIYSSVVKSLYSIYPRDIMNKSKILEYALISSSSSSCKVGDGKGCEPKDLNNSILKTSCHSSRIFRASKTSQDFHIKLTQQTNRRESTEVYNFYKDLELSYVICCTLRSKGFLFNYIFLIPAPFSSETMRRSPSCYGGDKTNI